LLQPADRDLVDGPADVVRGDGFDLAEPIGQVDDPVPGEGADALVVLEPTLP
jgi:hypothetical protein